MTVAVETPEHILLSDGNVSKLRPDGGYNLLAPTGATTWNIPSDIAAALLRREESIHLNAERIQRDRAELERVMLEELEKQERARREQEVKLERARREQEAKAAFLRSFDGFVLRRLAAVLGGTPSCTPEPYSELDYWPRRREQSK